jgi:hypothetical protein
MRLLRILFWGGLTLAAGLYLLSQRGGIDWPFAQDSSDPVRVNVDEAVDWESLRGFDAIDLRGGYRVVFHPASESRVEPEGSRNAQARIEARVEDHTLYLAHRKGYQKIDQDLVIHLYAPTLRAVKVSGAVEMSGTGLLRADHLTIDLSGAGQMTLAVEVDDLQADISGAGKYVLSGNAQTANFQIAGAGEVRAFDLITQRLSLRVAGAGNARVHATESLDVTLMGAGKVVYDGHPTQITPKIMGAGSLQARD